MMTESDAEETNHDVVHYRLSFPVDDHGYLRRACPACGLHFKIEPSPGDLSSLLAPSFRRVEEDYGLSLSSPSSATEEAPRFTCPYCGDENEAPDFLTEEISAYILHWIEREVVFPKLKSFQDELSAALGQGSSQARNSFISFEVRLDQSDIQAPMRPISGPEPLDMCVVELRCCQTSIKILEGWKDTISCPRCSKDLILT